MFPGKNKVVEDPALYHAVFYVQTIQSDHVCQLFLMQVGLKNDWLYSCGIETSIK
jgi:hypothetical protein